MLVGWSVGQWVGPSVRPHIEILQNLLTSKIGYVAIASHLGFGNNLVFLHFDFHFLGAKSASIRDCIRRSVGRSIRPSVPMMQLRGKLVMSRLLREEEKEEENWFRRDSFAPRD
jgi:hypothetical protein